MKDGRNNMKFTCDKALLSAAINIVSRACAAKSPIPSLEGILVEAGTANIRLTGYDLKRGMYTTVDAEVAEPGAVVLGARIFGDIIRSLPSGEVTIKSADGINVSISCGNSDFSIVGTDYNDYPELPGIDSHESVSIPQDILGRMIRETIFAVSDNEARPVYTGELFEITGGVLTMIAVDGYRLALRRETIDCGGDDKSFIVPGKSLSDLEKLCGETDEPVKICLGAKHISFSVDRTVLISRRLEGDFINYHKAVPSVFGTELTAGRTAVQHTVERVSLIIDDKMKNPVRCTFLDGFVKMSCATSLGKADDICNLDGDGKGLEIGFNNKYLLDALKAAPADDIKICLNSGSSPCVIKPAEEEDDSFLYMVLPVRLKAE